MRPPTARSRRSRSFAQSGALQQALDVGTGSGVLAIAMRLMGVGQVCAIDIDALALENARENAALNSLGGKIRFATTPLARLRRRFDLITANILSSTLIGMASALTRLLARRGLLILGGILNREAADGTQDLPAAPAMPRHTARPWMEHAGARAMKRAANLHAICDIVGGGRRRGRTGRRRGTPSYARRDAPAAGSRGRAVRRTRRGVRGHHQKLRDAPRGSRNRRGDALARGSHLPD